MKRLIQGIAVAGGVLFMMALAPDAASASDDTRALQGDCSATTIAPQDSGVAAITFLSTASATVSDVSLSLVWSGTSNEDVIIALDGPTGLTSTLTAGAPGAGARLAFGDTGESFAADLGHPNTELVGRAKPLEAFHQFSGVSSGGAWRVIALNVSDADLVIESCELVLTVKDAKTPTPTASPVVDPSPSALPASREGSGNASPDAGMALANSGSEALPFVLGGCALLIAGAAIFVLVKRRSKTTILVLVLGLVVGGAATAPPTRAHALDSAPTRGVFPPGVDIFNPVWGVWTGTMSIAQNASFDYRNVEGLIDQWGEVTAKTDFVVQALGTDSGSFETSSTTDGGTATITEQSLTDHRHTATLDCVAEGTVTLSSGSGNLGVSLYPLVDEGIFKMGFGSEGGPQSAQIQYSKAIVENDCGDPGFPQLDNIYGPLYSACAASDSTVRAFPLLRYVTEAKDGVESTFLAIRGETSEPCTQDGVVGSSTYTFDLVFHPGAALQPDQDADSVPDVVDACPTDPLNLCQAQICKPFEADLSGAIKSLSWFSWAVTGTVCEPPRANETGPSRLPLDITSIDQFGDVIIPAGTAAILSAAFTLQYDADSVASVPILDAAGNVSVTGSFDLCALSPLDFLPAGKIGGGLGKLITRAAHFGSSRIISKVAKFMVIEFNKQISRVAVELGDATSLFGDEAAATHVTDQLNSAFAELLSAPVDELLNAKVCVPMWEPTLTFAPRADGTGVVFSVSDQGAPIPEVTYTLRSAQI